MAARPSLPDREPPGRGPPRIRRAARALLVSSEDELLLMRLNMPNGRFWLTPGGGLQPGESARAGLVRELHEETGRRGLVPGAEVWRRTVRFTLAGRETEQRERYFLVRTRRFEPDARNMPEEAERDWFEGFHWWCLADIERSGDRFAPRRLAHYLARLLVEGPPATPIDTGV